MTANDQNSIPATLRSRGWPHPRTYFLAAAVFVLDGFVEGTGVLVFTTFIFVVPTLILLSLLRWKKPADRKRFFLAAIIYGCAAVGALLLIHADTRAAGRRAEKIIAACSEYKQRNGVYPPNLEALVPAHLPAVPRARERARDYARFEYSSERTNASLLYVSSPSYGRIRYDFASRTWGEHD